MKVFQKHFVSTTVIRMVGGRRAAPIAAEDLVNGAHMGRKYSGRGVLQVDVRATEEDDNGITRSENDERYYNSNSVDRFDGNSSSQDLAMVDEYKPAEYRGGSVFENNHKILNGDQIMGMKVKPGHSNHKGKAVNADYYRGNSKRQGSGDAILGQQIYVGASIQPMSNMYEANVMESDGDMVLGYDFSNKKI